MTGLGAQVRAEPQGTLPRMRHRAILRLLRPAESAARRLIIALAYGIAPNTTSDVPPLGPAPAGRRAGSGSSPGARIALPLFDRLRRVEPRRPTLSALPRICVPGFTERRPVPVRQMLAPDDPVSARRLMLRLDALGRALDDLPAQARRFARWRDAVGAQTGKTSDAARVPAGNPISGSQHNQIRRKRIWPLRMGRPPGLTRRPTHEVHDILNHAHELAWWALERRDTS